ncbi:MAG: acetylxylan esterase [Planctomycetes bacterium]|nr:acetylxylan esterase [Planctomycetota bacterium]
MSIVLAFCIFLAPQAGGAPSGFAELDVKAVLERPVIGPKQALEDVQDYLAGRIPAVPRFESAAEWEKYAGALRAQVLEEVIFRGEAAAWRDARTRVEWLQAIPGGPGYRIRKLRYEALPGLWIPALLYEPERLEGKTPVILNVNGHEGRGKAVPYKQIRCINQAKRGMLALNTEWFGMGQLNAEGYHHARMNQIDLCGTRGIAVFYLAMSRGLDILLSLEHADPERLAVTGLSGGGWQTIFISSLDPRVKLTHPVAGYSSFLTRIFNHSDLGDSEQTPCDLAAFADYNHLTAMMAPRYTLLTFNSKDDCCFASGHALQPLLDAARPVFALYGKAENLRHHVNDDPGNHNYEIDNRQAFYRALKDYFYAGRPEFNAEEISSAEEVKTAEELQVELPVGNADFHTLALELSKALPREMKLPGDPAAARLWREEAAKRLKEVTRAKEWNVAARPVEAAREGPVKITWWQLRIGRAWTVPAVELEPESPQGTAVVVADGGRAGAADLARELLAQGRRVLAVDPFYFGESRISSHDFLFALLAASVGDRPLGIQASQLAAIARWLEQRGAGPATLHAAGPRSGLFSLVAAGLERKAIAGVKLKDDLASLKEIIDKSWRADQMPELFCFGLLEAFDIPQLKKLAEAAYD